MPLPGAEAYERASIEKKAAILEEWLHLGEDIARAEGLTFPDDVEFELCEENLMLSYASMGTTNRPFHWRWGKNRDLMKMQHHYGFSRIYELVLPTDPPYAFLGINNSFVTQLLTMLHVIAHVDFFANNARFRSGISPARAMRMFKAHQEKTDEYIALAGMEKVEEWLSAVLAVDHHGRRPYALRRKTPEELQKEMLSLHRAKEEDEYPELFPAQRLPAGDQDNKREPDEDILSVILAENRHEEWQAGLITIGIEEAMFEQPLMETKIMNEGWASWWHKRLFQILCERGYISSLDVIMEYASLDSNVVHPTGGQLNPYYLGYMVFKNIEECYDRPKDDHWWAWRKAADIGTISGREKMLFARACDHDASFLRAYLTPKLADELQLFSYAPRNTQYIVTDVVRDEETFEHIRDTLIQTLPVNNAPIIQVVDTRYEGEKLVLQHVFDGRELLLPYAKKTLEHIHLLWGKRDVILYTTMTNKKKKLVVTKGGFSNIDI